VPPGVFHNRGSVHRPSTRDPLKEDWQTQKQFLFQEKAKKKLDSFIDPTSREIDFGS